MSRSRVAVIGAGMAGLIVATRLAGSADLVVLDKGRGVGGRLATRRIGDATFDHGAQFITTHSLEFAEIINGLVKKGVVADWFHGQVGPNGAKSSDGHVRYRGVVSMNAIAKTLASGLDIRTSSQITSIEQNGSGWKLQLSDETSLTADAVVSTAPVPQALALLEAGKTELSPADTIALGTIEYEPCIAVMAVLDGPSGIAAPGAIAPSEGPIDWIADNQMKGISPVSAVTIHASADFSRAAWDLADDAIADKLLTAAGLIDRSVKGSVQLQRWRYARPSVIHPDRCLVAEHLPPLVFAGDAFGGAKVEGAALSGIAASDAVHELLNAQR
ncbi:MAG: FAD-dependent oxidoreductase [Acidimicrobiales bacterium]